MIHIISTGLNAPTKARCIASVDSQDFDEYRFTYVESEPNVCALENFYRIASKEDPHTILVSLDGDDWFHGSGVLRRISDAYSDPNVWMTYGSFRYADGRAGFAAPVVGNPRREAWSMTHLKTFRASLFHKLGDDELKREGKFRDLCWDMAIMMPMYEMAGPERARFIPDVLYTYNYANSWEHNVSREERQRERDMNLEIRMLPSMDLLEAL